MIKIVYYRDNDMHELYIKGHAGYDNTGNDIVCSAVSAIAYTLLGALNNYEEDVTRLDTIENSGDFAVICEGNNKIAIVFETVVIGFMQIANSYPDYVKVRIKP